MSKNKHLSGKRVLFLGGSTGRDQLMLALAKELEKKHDIEASFLVIGKGKDFLYKNEGIPTEKILFIDFNDYLPIESISNNSETSFSPNIEFVRAAEEKYNIGGE